MANPKIVTIFGGSGFVGRYIAQRMAKQGWRVRVAVRRPNEALFVRPYGTVGQVEPILANVRDEDSTMRAISGADAVVNCVGILHETSRQRFGAVHIESAGRIARLTAEAGITNLVHLSAIGADVDADSEYARTKGEGEQAVLKANPAAVILRPSVVFGPEDRLFNRFARIARISPVIPLVGGATRFQPVYVDDVAAAVEAAVMSGDVQGVFELGGPDIESFRALMARMLRVVRRRRMLVDVPFILANVDASIFDFGQFITLGLWTNTILTRDQVKLLRHDNIVGDGAQTLADLGVTATPMECVLSEYLYCHRPFGQYTSIRESADNLRG